MKKDNSIFLKHILEAIGDIEDYIKDTPSPEDFITDKKTHDAVLRSFPQSSGARASFFMFFNKEYCNHDNNNTSNKNF